MTSGSSMPRWAGPAPVVFLLLWSGGFTVGKVGVAYAEPLTLLALRYALALGALTLGFLWLRPALPRSPRAWLDIAVVGFLIQVVYFGLNYFAFSRNVPAGTVALITSLQPILVALLAPHLIGETVGVRRWIGLLLGLGGAGCVIVSQSAIDLGSLLGMAASVGALCGMTAATLYEKRFGTPQHPVPANMIQYAVGLAATLPLALVLEDMRIAWTLELGIALFYLVIGNSIIAITLLIAMLRRGEASAVSALFFLVPPLAAVIAWAVLGEVPRPLAWFGMLVAAIGVALVVVRKSPRV